MSLVTSPSGQTNFASTGVPVVVLPAATTAYTVTLAQSGSIIQLNAIAAACTITLPPTAAAAGFNCKIVVGTALGAAGATTITSTAGTFTATLINQNATTNAALQNNIGFQNASARGANFDIVCDGVTYMCFGRSTGAGNVLCPYAAP